MSVAAILDDARRRLANAPREALGELMQPRRVLGIGRSPRIVPRGEAWHLGVLLLTDDAALATGDIVRARQEARRGYTAESQRQRAELAAAAYRGGFPEGRAVHIGWRALDVVALDAREEASDPLLMLDGIACVRWSAAGAPTPLARYLEDRIDLLSRPPQGAG